MTALEVVPITRIIRQREQRLLLVQDMEIVKREHVIVFMDMLEKTVNLVKMDSPKLHLDAEPILMMEVRTQIPTLV